MRRAGRRDGDGYCPPGEDLQDVWCDESCDVWRESTRSNPLPLGGEGLGEGRELLAHSQRFGPLVGEADDRVGEYAVAGDRNAQSNRTRRRQARQERKPRPRRTSAFILRALEVDRTQRAHGCGHTHHFTEQSEHEQPEAAALRQRSRDRELSEETRQRRRAGQREERERDRRRTSRPQQSETPPPHPAGL